MNFTTQNEIAREEAIENARRGIRPTATHRPMTARYTSTSVCADCDETGAKAGWRHPPLPCVRCGAPTGRVYSGSVS